jgi:hypothetical protein
MSSLIVLYVLAVMDFACCAFRSASGRVALLDKRDFFRHSIVNALLWGHVLLAGIWTVIVVGVLIAPDPPMLIDELERAARGLLIVYVPYAALFMLALLLRLSTSVDVRSVTSTLVLGPMTFVRPLVAALGVLSAIIVCPRPEILFLGAFTIAAMLGFEVCLDWRNTHALDGM